MEFYNIAFKCEGNKIDDLLEKVYKYAKYKEVKKKKFFINIYATYILRKFLKLLELYYHIKWNTITKLHVLPSGLINIAIQDLRRLLEIETKLHGNEEYKNIFWRNYTRGRYYLIEDKTESNLCISKLCEFLEEKFKDIKFLDRFNDMNSMMKLFDILNRIDSQIEDNRYFQTIFRTIFEHSIDDRSRENAFVKLFFDSMVSKHLPEYLFKERNNVSKDILMSGSVLTDNILKYLLNFMRLEDLIVVLIFRLAYSERSGEKIMTLDEFEVWKNAFNKLTVRKNIDDLKKQKFVDEICSQISESYVSHFISGEFIEWMWYSVFKDFDENTYEEFIKLGINRIRRNFSLDSYIIVRLLLCNYSYWPLCVYGFKEENKKQIESEIDSIKDILNKERISI